MKLSRNVGLYGVYMLIAALLNRECAENHYMTTYYDVGLVYPPSDVKKYQNYVE